MRIIATMLIVVGLVEFCSAQQPAHEAAHQVTKIPFEIDNLSAAQRAVIRAGHEVDNSSYLIRSRPVVFQIVLTGNHADELRNTGSIEQDVDVLIYALGEAQGDRLVDYAWIEHAETGEVIWKMTPQNSEFAGGDRRNRKSVERRTLRPGSYRLRYVSNGTHAYPDWQAAAPERERFYGVTVFNMTALPLIEERLKRAAVPSLATSLQPRR